MALTGQLSDLSLAELIEFFCNQHKTGRLKVAYAPAPGFFYFQNGALVDAKIGVLRGVDAVYYALTMQNASFKFSPTTSTYPRTVHQPWTQVALEGLRRMDEGIKPVEAFPEGDTSYLNDPEYLSDIDIEEGEAGTLAKRSNAVPMSLIMDEESGGNRKTIVMAVAAAASVVLLIGLIGIPAGWYSSKTSAAPQPAPVAPAPAPANPVPDPVATKVVTPAPSTTAADPARERELAAERKRAEDKLRAQREKDLATKEPKVEPKAGPKMVTVTVTYDESGHVTSASGSDSTAVRIARGKRFPAGKAGSTTLSIPIN